MMTSIHALSGIDTNILKETNSSTQLTGKESFTYALEAAKDLITSNVASEAEVSQKTVDFMTGSNDNIVDLMVAQEKSSIMLQYTLQVRNGLLSAYKEIMSLSI